MKIETPMLSLFTNEYYRNNAIFPFLCKNWVKRNFSEVPDCISLEFSDTFVRGAIPIQFKRMNEYIIWGYSKQRIFYNLLWGHLQMFLNDNFTITEEKPTKLWVTLYKYE
jgi:hypothetical protein